MTRFKDGPAQGTILDLKRQPQLLRVVIDEMGNVDALDMFDDEARPTETIHLYVRMGEPRMMFTCGRSGYSDHRVIADYKHCAVNVNDATLRDTASWIKWATENVEKITLSGSG